MKYKPLGHKSYGSIPHLPNSRIGPGDYHCPEGLATIMTVKKRSKHDRIIVQEKLDGSNVGVALQGGKIYPLVRAGYVASTSPYEQHQLFYIWALQNQERFLAVLNDGERLCGEWLAQAHGTRYQLTHEPFVVFDLMRKHERTPYTEFSERIRAGDFVPSNLIHDGDAISVEAAMEILGEYGGHGARDLVEGAVWRLEENQMINPRKGGPDRAWKLVEIAKFVRKDKVDGCYLPEMTGGEPIWNWRPPKKGENWTE